MVLSLFSLFLLEARGLADLFPLSLPFAIEIEKIEAIFFLERGVSDRPTLIVYVLSNVLKGPLGRTFSR